MKKEIKVSKKMENLLKVLLTISSGFLTFMISLRYEHNFTMAGVVCSWVLMGSIMYYKVSIKKINVKTLLISIIPGLIAFEILSCKAFLESIKIFYPRYRSGVTNLDVDFLRMMGIPITIFLTYLFIDKVVPIIIKFFKSFDKTEKTFIIASTIAAIIGAYILTDKTTVFAYPMYQNKFTPYDVLYTLDSTMDAYNNISSFANDIRNPLFGIMALPFSVIATFIGKIMPFGRMGFSFVTALTAVQVVIVAITLILLTRLLKIEEKQKPYFYALCLATLPFLLFSLVIEQYVVSVFYLILFIYVFVETKTKTNYLYVASTGSILTSGVLFPLISKAKNFKQWFVNVFDCFMVFVTVTIIGGQLPQVFKVVDTLKELLGSFSGHITAEAKLYRFTYFLKDMFFATPGQIVAPKGYPSYLSIDPTNINIIGIALLLICLISIFLNRKNKFALISGSWVAFSIVLLYFVGWGAPENGYILYSYYFSWAYLSLYYLFFKKIFEKKPKLFKGTIITTIIIMLIVNIPVLYKILSFAVTYYK